MHGIGFIRNHPGSYVLAAPSLPPTSALIFVHGFGGDSTGTWKHVQELVDVDPYSNLFATSDLFFYDYECTRYRIPYASDELNKFITQILEDREAPYKAVHLIGHSAGAVVIRQLLLELVRGTAVSPYKEILVSSNPILFAPAHFGFRHALAALLVVEQIPFLSLAAAVWLLARGEVYGDLQEDAPVLTELKDQTTEFREALKLPGLQAKIAWGKKEQVVHVLDYKRDVRLAFRENYDHFSICKPTAQDHAPLKWIGDAVLGARIDAT